MSDMNRSCFAGFFDPDALHIDRHECTAVGRRCRTSRPSSSALVFNHCFCGRIRFGEGMLSSQAGSHAVSQSQPLCAGSWGKASERTNDLLPRPLRCAYRLDQKIVIVGFPLVRFGRFPDVHRTLCTSHQLALQVKILMHFVTILHASKAAVEYKRLLTIPGLKKAEKRGSRVS